MKSNSVEEKLDKMYKLYTVWLSILTCGILAFVYNYGQNIQHLTELDSKYVNVLTQFNNTVNQQDKRIDDNTSYINNRLKNLESIMFTKSKLIEENVNTINKNVQSLNMKNLETEHKISNIENTYSKSVVKNDVLVPSQETIEIKKSKKSSSKKP